MIKRSYLNRENKLPLNPLSRPSDAIMHWPKTDRCAKEPTTILLSISMQHVGYIANPGVCAGYPGTHGTVTFQCANHPNPHRPQMA